MDLEKFGDNEIKETATHAAGSNRASLNMGFGHLAFNMGYEDKYFPMKRRGSFSKVFYHDLLKMCSVE